MTEDGAVAHIDNLAKKYMGKDVYPSTMPRMSVRSTKLYQVALESTFRQPWPVMPTKAGIHVFLVKPLALDACKLGNDPHNREIPQGMPEDFGNNRSPARSRILLACAQLLSAHRR